MFDALYFHHRKGTVSISAVRHIDDPALQQVIPMQLIQHLHRLGVVDIANPEMDPSISHTLPPSLRILSVFRLIFPSLRFCATPLPAPLLAEAFDNPQNRQGEGRPKCFSQANIPKGIADPAEEFRKRVSELESIEGG